MITRFAPSPTGPLHLGHAYSAMLAHDMATAENGTFLLRIEDIDQTRARPKWEARIYDDLRWLGLGWPEPVMRQSDRQVAYDAALDSLWHKGLLYPCTCTRRDIADALAAPQEGAPLLGPDGLVYPGTCHPGTGTGPPIAMERPRDVTLRLHMSAAVGHVEADADGLIGRFGETGTHPGAIAVSGTDLTQSIGDVVVARRDMGTSYHLSVVIDDAEQAVTDVVRGEDLFEATKIHVLLQRLLGLPTPRYHHHRLVRDDTGRRLAKRDDSRAISLYRAEGATPDDIRRLVGLPVPLSVT